MGRAFDATGSYETLLARLAAATLGVAGLMLLLPRYGDGVPGVPEVPGVPGAAGVRRLNDRRERSARTVDDEAAIAS